MKILVIVINLIILIFVISFIFWDVQAVAESEVVGSYVADYDIPLDSLELLPDGKCIHVYQLEGSAIMYDTTKWEYSLIEVENRHPKSYIAFLKFSEVYNKLIGKPYDAGHIPQIDIVKEIWKEKTILRRSYRIYIVLVNSGKYRFNKVQ